MWGNLFFRSRSNSKATAIKNIGGTGGSPVPKRRFDADDYDAHTVNGVTIYASPDDNALCSIDKRVEPEIVSIPSDIPSKSSDRFKGNTYDRPSDFKNSRPCPAPFDYSMFKVNILESRARLMETPTPVSAEAPAATDVPIPETITVISPEIPEDSAVPDIPVPETITVVSPEIPEEPVTMTPVEEIVDEPVPVPEVTEIEEIPEEPVITENISVLDNVLDDSFDDAPAPVYPYSDVEIPAAPIANTPSETVVSDIAEASLSASELGIRIAAVSAARLQSVIALAPVPEAPVSSLAEASAVATGVALAVSAASAGAIRDVVNRKIALAAEAERKAAAILETTASVETAVRSALAVRVAAEESARIAEVERKAAAILETTASVETAVRSALAVKVAAEESTRIAEAERKAAAILETTSSVETAVRNALTVKVAAEESARAATIDALVKADAQAVTVSVVSASKSAEAVATEITRIQKAATHETPIDEVTVEEAPAGEIDLLHPDYGMGIVGNAGMAMTSEVEENVQLSIGSIFDPIPPMSVPEEDDDALIQPEYNPDRTDILDSDPTAPIDAFKPSEVASKTVPDYAKDLFGSGIVKDAPAEVGKRTEHNVNPKDVSAILGGTYTIPKPPVRHVSVDEPADIPVVEISIETQPDMDTKDVSAVEESSEEVTDGVVGDHLVLGPIKHKPINPKDVSAILFG